MHISKINEILESIKEVDVATYDHLERTAMFTFAIAKELKFKPEQMEQAYFAGLLHDMGVLASCDRNQKECAKIGATILKLIDETKIISEVVKHQYDFYLMEEISLISSLSEIVNLASEYDELKNVKSLDHEEAIEILLKNNYQDNLVTRFNNVLVKEELI